MASLPGLLVAAVICAVLTTLSTSLYCLNRCKKTSGRLLRKEYLFIFIVLVTPLVPFGIRTDLGLQSLLVLSILELVLLCGLFYITAHRDNSAYEQDLRYVDAMNLHVSPGRG